MYPATDEQSYFQDVEDEFYCQICGGVFKTWNGWKCHMLSKSHEAKNIRCRSCLRTFKTPALVIMHLEQGKCINISRSSITSAVRSWEIASGNRNLFTVPQLGWREDMGSSSQSLRYATEDSFDGYFFECPMCPREFQKLNHLNQHLNSPAHDSENYHCRKCGTKFKLLSSLIQHFESGKCGAISYKNVKKLVRGAIGHIRQIDYRVEGN